MAIPKIKIPKFLADKISVRQPSEWSHLSDREAWAVFKLMTLHIFDAGEIPVAALTALNRWKIVGRSFSGGFIVRSPEAIFELQPEVAAKLAEPLRFLLKPSGSPWRPGRFGRRRPISADLSELTLVDWLAVENYLQRVISTGDFSLLSRLGPILMRRRSGRIFRGEFSMPQATAIFYWISSVKNWLRVRFPDFYSDGAPVDPAAITPKMLQDSMDAQIRALTKGDITKESEVLKMPMYRALSELNALAREYREIKEMNK